MLAQVRATQAVPDPAIVLVGDRNMRYGALCTDSGGTYRTVQTAQVTVSGLQLTFGNWYTQADPVGDTDGPNAYTINACYLEHGGTATQVLFGGSPSVSIPPGGEAVGTVTKAITTGQQYFIRSYVTPNVGGGSYPRLSVGAIDSVNERSEKGSNLANGTGTGGLTSSAGHVFGPCMITGTLVTGTVRSVSVMGSSTFAGIGDTFNSPTAIGFPYRALSGHRAFLLYALSGESAQRFLTNAGHRETHLGQYTKYLIQGLGENDLQGGRSLAQIQADLLQIWSEAVTRNPGLRTFQVTMKPKTSSTDGWATVGNQTTNSTTEAVRPSLNAWIRAGAPTVSGVAVTPGTGGALVAGQAGHPLWGYLEVADLCESARDSGLWKAGYTDDGIHPNGTGHLALAPSIDLARLS